MDTAAITPDPIHAQDSTVIVTRPQRRTVAIAAFLVTLVAWLTLPLSYWLSMALALAGLVLAIIGLRQARRCWHNLSLTVLVAAAVLLLVFIVFWAAIYLALA